MQIEKSLNYGVYRIDGDIVRVNYAIILGVVLIAGMVPLASAQTDEQGAIGGDVGYYAVHCNVDGAKVSFDNDLKGEIKDGELVVSVYTTGTPYTTVCIEADGYETYTASIDQYPAKGQTVEIDATLTPVTTKAPLSPLSALGALGVLGAVLVLHRKN
ncbi:MAG: hypothetical protein PWP08_200 [Methanofollis sp.]|nr:hypothetical protein [Methanofollis sp.]